MKILNKTHNLENEISSLSLRQWYSKGIQFLGKENGESA